MVKIFMFGQNSHLCQNISIENFIQTLSKKVFLADTRHSISVPGEYAFSGSLERVVVGQHGLEQLVRGLQPEVGAAHFKRNSRPRPFSDLGTHSTVQLIKQKRFQKMVKKKQW